MGQAKGASQRGNSELVLKKMGQPPHYYLYYCENKVVNSKSTIINAAIFISLALVGCAENGVQTAERQANNARKTTPIEVHINAPFSASDAKAALAKGDYNVSQTIGVRDILFSPLSKLALFYG